MEKFRTEVIFSRVPYLSNGILHLGLTVFFLEAPLQGVLEGLPKWEPRARAQFYLGYSPFHAGSVALVLNIITVHISPHYHVVFYEIISDVENRRTVSVLGNWKTW